MDSPTRATVRRALDELKPYLASYVSQMLASALRARRPARSDMQALLTSVLDNWDTVFARTLPATVRHYVFELKDVRNRWAHEEPFTEDEARRAVDTVRLIAKAIGAPVNVLENLAVPAPSGSAVAERTSSPGSRVRQAIAGTKATPTAAAPANGPTVRTGDGVILNAAELSDEQVANQRVLCPGCERKVFEHWPFGWDAHAAHSCVGVQRGSEQERKADYRRRFAHLFRDAGAGAAPARQRDVMRRVYGHWAPDEDRVVREYAAAERRGEVARARNTYGLSSEDYARRLLADGMKKGWLLPADTRGAGRVD